MSRTKPTPFEQAMCAVYCARCGALAGEWCKSRSGRIIANLHSIRHYCIMPIVEPIIEEYEAKLRELYRRAS